MRLFTYITSASILLTSAAPVLAANTQEELKNECMSELNIESTEGLSAPQLFYLRRCIIKKKNAAARQIALKRDKIRDQVRLQTAQERVPANVRARYSGRMIRILQKRQYLKSLQSPRRRTLGKAIKSEISRQRAEVRRNTQSKDREESRIHTNRIRAIYEMQVGCMGLKSYERRECILRQLHNLNLYDN